MSEPQRSAAPPLPQGGHGALQERIESLRLGGAWRLDPARFRYLEALSRRMPGQHEAVQCVLEQKLHRALADYADRLAGPAKPANPARTSAACVPLAQLNGYIRSAVRAGLEPPPPGETHEPDELKSMRHFRHAWSRSRSRHQLEQAVARKPENAGPLNSHALVLQSLALMQELSPDYLRRFLMYVESLQWLDQANAAYPDQPARQAKAAKPARPRRQKK